jgi:DNA repair exonuclease SbcCD ATPase subunit
MSEETNTWGEYSKLVLKELERLNESTEKMRTDMDQRFNELNTKITEIKNIEGKVASQSAWIEKVNEIWSPTQMKEAKDEIYKQKTRWVAAIAIISFVQMLIGIGITIWVKLH